MLPLILVSLGLCNQSDTYLSLNKINHERSWKKSEIIPFLKRIAFERLQFSSLFSNETFIRILINSKPKPISGCSQGPGQTCPLSQFINYVHKRYIKYQNFSQICHNNNQSNHFTFLN
ncbi:unnamed protein product [Rotaria sordida]|uniref:Uncharacterized protein n=1 Tax=Rotaria sordida TaxID=392033 RepID=A0A814D0V5_9BILA|nr:unnamed protein product [Rotaria sordida]CAF0946960.1 unnamed protein product [Rotaria sordida]CAF0991195.1 unnamed protein product [Rotaria sordida]